MEVAAQPFNCRLNRSEFLTKHRILFSKVLLLINLTWLGIWKIWIILWLFLSKTKFIQLLYKEISRPLTPEFYYENVWSLYFVSKFYLQIAYIQNKAWRFFSCCQAQSQPKLTHTCLTNSWFRHTSIIQSI